MQDLGLGWGSLNSAEAEAIASWHTNVARVPLNEDCWLGINGAPPKYAGANYRSAIEQWVQVLNAAGLVVILDLLSAAPGNYPATGQWPMADADHSITFWSQVSAAFAPDPSVIFDLFNEPMIGGSKPTAADWSCWLNGCPTGFALCPLDPTTGEFVKATGCPVVDYETAGMQQLVSAVRSSGATQPIMLGGLNWAGNPCGVSGDPGSSGTCEWLANLPKDPEGELIASFHAYNWTPCASLTCWQQGLAQVATSVPVITGELGEDDCSASFIDAYMNWADAHNISYLAQSWQPPNSSDSSLCVPSGGDIAPGDLGQNARLIANWTGTPNPIAPEGAAFKAHLAALASSST
jgi:hypothetical protein